MVSSTGPTDPNKLPVENSPVGIWVGGRPCYPEGWIGLIDVVAHLDFGGSSLSDESDALCIVWSLTSLILFSSSRNNVQGDVVATTQKAPQCAKTETKELLIRRKENNAISSPMRG